MYPAGRAVWLVDAVRDQLPQLTVQIVPFQETEKVHYFSALESSCDMIYATYNILDMHAMEHNICFLEVERIRFSMAVPKGHRLSDRESLNVCDLAGEHVMMMKRENSPINDALRARFEDVRPRIIVEDVTPNYTLGLFNRCAQEGFLLLSLEIWRDVHPDLVHIPLDVPDNVPCGFVYHEDPAGDARLFLDAVRKRYTASGKSLHEDGG